MLRQLRKTLERLEERAMLSLSHGPMPYGSVGEGPIRLGGSQHFADASPHIHALQHSEADKPQSLTGPRQLHPGLSGLNDGPDTLSSFAPQPRIGFNEQNWLPMPAWDRGFGLTNTPSSPALNYSVLNSAGTSWQPSQLPDPHYNTQFVDRY